MKTNKIKTNKFVLQTTAVLAATALVLTGCSGKEGSSAKSSDKTATDSASKGNTKIAASDYAPTPYDQVKDGGQLVNAIYEIPEQENVFHADSSSPTRTIWNWYNPQIALFDGEGNYSVNPDYITNVKEETKDGNTVVTFDIVPQAKWNDGTPIDWKAFETTWKINNGKDKAFHVSSTDGYERIKSVTRGKDDKEAVITFDGTYPWWKGLFNVIAHPALANVKNFNDYVKKVHPEWGAGPYKPQSVDFNKGEAIFVRNEKWWGPKGKLDKRIFRQMEDQASLNAFKNGEIDGTGVASKDRYAAVKDMKGIEIRTASMPFSVLYELNAKSPALSDIQVRKAVFQAIDRNTLSKIRFNGIPYHETPPGSLTAYPFQKNYEDNFSKALPDTGTKAAQQTLEKAGYKKNDKGIYAKDGKALSIRYTLFGDAASAKASAAATQKMLKDAGIDCVIDTHPSSEFSDVVNHRDWDLLPLAFSNSDPYLVAYFGQTYKSDSQLNLSSTGSKELDAKIEKLQQLPTAEEQEKRANELEVEAFQRYGLLPWANGADMAAVKKGLVNVGAMGFAIVPVENIGWAKDSK